MAYSNIRIWTDCANPHGELKFGAEPRAIAPRHGGLIPSWDDEEVSGDDRTPRADAPQPRITTRYPNLELEAEYESVMEPVNEKFHHLFEEKWYERKRIITSKRYDNEIRRILVDMLGGSKKANLLDELVKKIASATSEDDFKVCAYKYRRLLYKPNSCPAPTEVYESTMVQGIDPNRPSIHKIFEETDILDRISLAFGRDFNHQIRMRLVEETSDYILYEHSLFINYWPGMTRFVEDYE
jgi:hypothetical protein